MSQNQVDDHIEQLWGRIDAWLLANAPEVANALNTGATEEEIAAAENAMGVVFPDNVSASFRIHNGQIPDALGTNDGLGILNAPEFLSLDRMVEEWPIWKSLRDEGHFDGITSLTNGYTKTDWWNPKWLSLTSYGNGDSVCLDLDPAPGGQMGQIIQMRHDDAERNLIADSMTEWLQTFAEELERGEFATSDRYGGIVRRRN